jgi:adenosyl cobinamide kinase/adenosyl cobinamide phosphate guanylyltransferase
MINSKIHSHREGFATSWRRQLENFRHWDSQTRLMIKFWFSNRVVVVKCLNAMVTKIMKVRPQDLSCIP